MRTNEAPASSHTGAFLSRYTRVDAYGVALYVDARGPDWFVPTPAAAQLLTRVHEDRCDCTSDTAPVTRLLERIRPAHDTTYTGRHAHHRLARIRECWFHVTNRCNMQCRHCMFSSTGSCSEQTLQRDALLQTIDRVSALGCRIFYFTGGEPLIYPGFFDVCRHILNTPHTHVVILTNALQVEQCIGDLDALPHDRVHLQVSMDGSEPRHDNMRGRGAYAQLLKDLSLLRAHHYPVTLSMAVTSRNVDDMPHIIDTAATLGITAVHFMWLFVRGRAQQDTFVPPQTLTDHLLRAYTRARAHGVTIDNIEAIKSQVFTIPGTKHDLSNSGWESLAIGPDGGIYATPAMIGMPHMQAGHIHEGIEHVWRHSDVLQHIRRISVKDKPRRLDAPLQYLLGGGDIDHALHAHGTITGEDPYMPLYKNIALYLIAEHAGRSHGNGRVGIRCRMGEYLYECGPDSGPVMFTHSNCVQSLSTFDSHTLVNTFYSAAAQRTNDDIRNPVSYDEHEMAHIPEHLRVRSYGCGSPVMDCTLGPGDRLVDLGSGTGIECFIAAKKVGAHGAVYGIDMSPAMLQQAGEGQKRVADILGYDNMSFRHGLLESIPLEDDSVDFVISNCVINLTADKRTVFEEIMRILVPGGTLCISDIVRHTAIPLDMQYNERLRGECLAGAMHQEELFAVLEELGFTDAYLIRRYEYRRVRGYPFYAITYRARSPQKHTERLLMYRGPYDAITVDDTTIRRGQTRTVSCCDEAVTDESFFELDGSGNVTNVAQTTSCGVFVSPQDTHSAPAPARKDTHPAGCMVCGSPLVYHTGHTGRTCHYCGRTMSTNAACEAGHFVCDDCHARDARSYLRHVCLHTTMSNPLALFLHVRAHPLFPLHGPEYHSLVPAVFLTAYKNSGGRVDTGALDAAIERGASVAGGSCAFLGMCGAAIGVGIAYALILGATPYTGDIRQRIQTITHDIMKEVAAYKGARCCRRDGLIALQKGCVLSQRYLPVPVACTGDCVCTQYADNPECSNAACPWWPQHR